MLKIEHLRKHYTNFSLDCSLKVMPGCITGLIGQNGAGKSTTFKAVLGLITTDGGDITLLGKDIRTITAADKENLGVVLSDSGFSGYLTIGDILPVLGSLYQQFDKTFFYGTGTKSRAAPSQTDPGVFHRHEGEAQSSCRHLPQRPVFAPR